MHDNSDIYWASMSDEALLAKLGDFIKKNRLSRNQSQSEVAHAAGISRSTLSLLERGENVSLLTLIQVLRVLDLLHHMEAFNYREEISPIAYAKMKKSQRQRAGKKNNDSSSKEDVSW